MQMSQVFPHRHVSAYADRRTFSSRPWLLALRVGLVLLPTLIAAVYYGAIARDRYVSEARFVIRTASKPANLAGGLGALMQLIGMSRSEDDAYAVRDFLTSRDALHELESRIDLRAIYRNRDADPFIRYPSLLFRKTDEGFFVTSNTGCRWWSTTAAA